VLAVPLAVLSLLGLGVGPLRAKATTAAFEAYDDVRRTIAPRYLPLTPAAAVADSTRRGHPATSAVDRNTTTWWAQGPRGQGVGATLTITFDGPADLARLGVHNGAAGAGFALLARPRTVRVVLRDGPRVVGSSDLELADTPDFRSYPLTGSQVRSATLTVLRVYAGQGGRAAALSDLTFDRRG
jgi:hypothetical protein